MNTNMSRRSFLVGSGSAVLAAFLTACGSNDAAKGSAGSAAKGSGKTIYVLTPSEDHGWTGSVATFAKEKIEEVNKAGVYKAELQTADSASKQIQEVEDILAGNTDEIAGIVIQPMDDTVQSAIQSIVDAGIPYVAFDRIIEAVADTAVSNVKGDNEGIGAGSAAYFVENGMKPGDKVYVYQGDTSSVTTLRDSGFGEYLTGKIEFDGKKIADTKASFESLMGDESNAEIKWFYAEDDELAMGILEALNGGGISDATKDKIFATKPFITGCGGLDEYYEVIRGNSYQDIVKNLGGVMSVTYSPSMIQLAIQDMVDHLDGKEVAQDHVIKCENVTKDNVKDFKSFK